MACDIEAEEQLLNRACFEDVQCGLIDVQQDNGVDAPTSPKLYFSYIIKKMMMMMIFYYNTITHHLQSSFLVLLLSAVIIATISTNNRD